MKIRNIIIISLILFTSIYANGQIGAAIKECTSCYNTVTTGLYASALGVRTKAIGDYSFAGGYLSEAQRDVSFAFGNNTIAEGDASFAVGSETIAKGLASFASGNLTSALGNYSASFGWKTKANGNASFASGYLSEATGQYSVAMGLSCRSEGSYSISFGMNAIAMAGTDVVIGRYVKTTASGAMIIGSGYENEELVNNKNGTLMIGLNSTVPTLFIDKSNPFINKHTADVGIGTTEPQAKLHIKGNSGIDDASLFIEAGKWNTTNDFAEIRLGTNSAIIRNTYHKGFTVNNNYDFSFDVRNVGIGTTSPTEKLHVDGKVVIGGQNLVRPEGYKLFVEGGIFTEKIKVELVSNWSDFVFEKKYKLRSIGDLEMFIQKNKHLPEIPSAEHVKENGIDLVEMDAKLLQKVEELTLYLIQQQKEIELLKTKIKELEK